MLIYIYVHLYIYIYIRIYVHRWGKFGDRDVSRYPAPVER